MQKLITLIIPCLNEEKSLPFLFRRLDGLAENLAKYELEFLFINDGSCDDTLKILRQEAARNPRVSIVNFSRNFGKEIAVKAGLDFASGDAAVIIDADGQEPPELVPEMVKWWEKGYDDVYARRRVTRESFLKKFTSKVYYRALQKMSRGVEIQIDTGDFRLFSRRCVLALREIRETSRQNKAIFSWIGYKKKEILFDMGENNARKSTWNFSFFGRRNSLIDLAIDGFTSFTTIPLRFVTLIGLLISIFAFFDIIYVIIQHLLGVPRTEGFTTLLVVVLFLGGIQMIALGIIGEYIGRIFTETKNRPLYLVQDFSRGEIAEKVARNISQDESSREDGEIYAENNSRDLYQERYNLPETRESSDWEERENLDFAGEGRDDETVEEIRTFRRGEQKGRFRNSRKDASSRTNNHFRENRSDGLSREDLISPTQNLTSRFKRNSRNLQNTQGDFQQNSRRARLGLSRKPTLAINNFTQNNSAKSRAKTLLQNLNEDEK